MGVGYNNLSGQELGSCVESKCGKKPSYPISEPLRGISSEVMAKYVADLEKWDECYNKCRVYIPSAPSTQGRVGETTNSSSLETTSELGNQTDNTLSGTHGTTPIIAATPSSTITETSAEKPKMSTGLKIGIAAGILVLGFIGYKIFFGKKKSA